MSLYKRLMSLSFIFILTLGISACGSSDDGSDGGGVVETSTLSGTAAIGVPIKGKVYAKDANGVEVEVATGLNGSFTLNTTGMTPPFLLKIVPDDGSEILYSYALANNQTVNITPLTNLAVFLANNKTDMAGVYGNWTGTAISATAISEAVAIVTANFKVQITTALGSVPNYNILTEQFNADGTGIDAVLDNLIVTIDPVTSSVTVTDASSAVVVFIDNLDIESPVVNAPSNISVVATSSSGIAASNSTVAAFLSAATGSDNVGVVGAITNNAPTVFTAGSTQVTFTATDAIGNVGTAIATVVVTPFVTATPTIVSSGPLNNDVFTAASNGLADVQIEVVISNFNLANGAWSMIIDGATPGAAFFLTSTTKSFSVGTHSIVFQLTELGKPYTPLVDQNKDTVTFQVVAATSSDTIAPTVTAPASIIVTATNASGIAASDATVTAFLTGATAVDNIAVVGGVTNNNSLTIFPLGDTIVTFSAQDAAENIGTASATITVNAAVATGIIPVVTPPSDTTVFIPSGSSTISIYDPAIQSFLNSASATDDVGVIGKIQVDLAPTIYLGVKTVRFYAVDADNNVGVAHATLTVLPSVDTTAPRWVSYVPTLFVRAATGETTVLKSDSRIVSFLNSPVFDDFDTVNPLGSNVVTNNAPASFSLGTNSVVLSVTDKAGNQRQQTVSIIVQAADTVDIVRPILMLGSIDGRSGITLYLANGATSVPSTDSTFQAIVSAIIVLDNVDTNVTVTHDAPANFPVGNTTVTLTATDSAGNTKTLSLFIVVEGVDPNAPVVTAPANISLVANTERGYVNLGGLLQTYLFSATSSSLARPIARPINPNVSIQRIYPVGVTLVRFDDAGGEAYSTVTVTPIGGRKYKIDAVAGSANQVGTSANGTSASNALLSFPESIALDPNGQIYFDNASSTIRKIDASGNLITVAGGGLSGDGGQATAAQISSPKELTFDAAGNFYFYEAGQYRIRKVDVSGVISTIAGTGTKGFSGDGGPAAQAMIGGSVGVVLGIAFDSLDNMYITDGQRRIRKITPTGVITTIAGTGVAGFTADGALASNANMLPSGIAIDVNDVIYFSDGNTIRKIDASGLLTTIANIGARALRIDASGQLYFIVGNTIHMIDEQGNDVVIGGFLGDSTHNPIGYSGNAGLATVAAMQPSSIALDATGNVYLAERNNKTIRKMVPLGRNIGGGDTVAPIVTAPMITTLTQGSSEFTNWLASVTATDDVGVVGSIINNSSNAAIGLNTVSFFANDAAGNTGWAFSDLTINPLVLTWSETASGFSFLTDIASNGSDYVATNSLGSIIHSSDKVNWIETEVGTGNGLYSVNWNGTQFIAVGGAGAVKTSPDGMTWTSQTSGLGTFDTMRDIIWTGSKYIAVGSAGTSTTPLFATSTNGVTWTQQTTPTLGSFGSSPGTVWHVVMASNNIVAVGDNGVFSSPDGITWTQQTVSNSPYVNDNLHSIAFVNGQFIAGGNAGNVYTSTDASSWTVHSTTTGRAINDIVANGSLMMAVGSVGTSQTSFDGISWSAGNVIAAPSNLSAGLVSVITDNSGFVVIDSLGNIYSSQ